MICKQNKAVEHNWNAAVIYCIIFNFLVLGYLQSKAEVMIFGVLKFLKVRHVH